MTLISWAIDLPMVRALRNTNFARFVVASAISQLGDGVFAVALTWQVFSVSDVPSALALVVFARTVALMIATLYGGVLSDRYDRRTVVVICDLVRGCTIGALALLTVSDHASLPAIAACMALYGIANGVFFPASSALVPDLVGNDDLVGANAMRALLRPTTVLILGPAAGGILVAALGTTASFAADAASFFVSALLVAGIRAPSSARAARANPLAQVGVAVGFVARARWLLVSLVGAVAVYFCFVGPYQVLMPHVVKSLSHGDPRALGLVYTVGGVGAVLASFVFGSVRVARLLTVMYLCWAVGTAAIAGFGFANAVWIAAAAAFVVDFMMEAGGILWASLLQLHVPRAMLGRISSLDWLSYAIPSAISVAVVAPAAALVGEQRLLIVAPLCGGALMLALLFVPNVRDIDDAGPVA